MTTPLIYLAWTLVLGFAQVGAAALAKRAQEPPLWGAGARDAGEPHYTGVAARLMRAQSNLFETLPLFAGAVLLAHVTAHDGSLATWGATLYFWGRLLYVPLYAAGTPYVRTLVWVVAAVGLCLVLAACLVSV